MGVRGGGAVRGGRGAGRSPSFFHRVDRPLVRPAVPSVAFAAASTSERSFIMVREGVKGAWKSVCEGRGHYWLEAQTRPCTYPRVPARTRTLSPTPARGEQVKPDGVHRGLVGDIIKRFEAKGYKLVACKVLQPSRDLASAHYAEHDGKPFFPKLVDFLTRRGALVSPPASKNPSTRPINLSAQFAHERSSAVVAMVLEGKDVVRYGRQMIGATNPTASAPGTIRGDVSGGRKGGGEGREGAHCAARGAGQF